MSTDSDETDYEFSGAPATIEIIEAPKFPPPRHPAEPDLFVRHEGVPGHVQDALTHARIVIVGAGGLGSWVALALARSGVRNLTIIDPDRFDLTNASRQLIFRGDIGEAKAVAVARNVAPHMIAGGIVVAMPVAFEDAIRAHIVGADLLIVGVDNNKCRWSTSRYARRHHIPVIFSMLSLDSLRIHVFLQGSQRQDACLWCALPNLPVDGVAPCASAVICGGLIAAGHVTWFAHRALMGSPPAFAPVNWKTIDLTAASTGDVSTVYQRNECPVCSEAACCIPGEGGGD
jgi:molybdopterin/thiamine biosynthesis adenylyltransferase